ncbi:hypothetical protein [Nocardioides jejuensis]|uniref:Phage gp6-like head-tail connector protein n=1 Tax=Nocardioides jejuensis TaxID=2502782 RepID=A0A4R1BY68_9ACTN|nr:hypothetical protein [Nocardioides jejuensis]TCJ23024.1 hypothetical protein EPD65_11725 [Nocardioides jejuensis]
MADILTLDDARKALRLAVADTSNDTDLTETYIPAVTPIVEDVVGPVMSRTGLTFTTDGGVVSIDLPTAFTAITSVTESGSALTEGTDFVADPKSGLVHRGSAAGRFLFAAGVRNVTVTYTVGYAAAAANVLANHRLAARIILRQMWQADQQGARPGLGSTDTETTPSGFLIPRRAAELLRSTPNLPGFA